MTDAVLELIASLERRLAKAEDRIRELESRQPIVITQLLPLPAQQPARQYGDIRWHQQPPIVT
jgi:hypothetical protein